MPTEVNESVLKYTVQGLQNIEKANKALLDIAKTNAKLAQSNRQLGQTAPVIQNTFKSIDASGTKLTQSLKTVGSQVGKLKTSISTTTKPLEEFNAKTLTLGITWRGVGRIIIGSTISRSVSVFVRALREGITGVAEFTRRVAEIETISLRSRLTFEDWASSVRKLSDALGTPILDVAEGQYQVLSNQIAKGAEATRFLAEAQKFAITAVTTTTDAVQLLSGALNAFGKDAGDAREVAGQFFKTIELGRVRASDIANTFGDVAIIGNQLGVTLEELNAGLATLTIQGLAPSRAMTGLRNVMLKLIRPTDAMKELFRKLGVSSGQAAVETFGFAGVLREIAKEVESTGDPLNQLGTLFGRLRAIVGASGLVGALEKFDSNLESIKNGVVDLDAAFKKIEDSIGFRLGQQLQRITNFFQRDIGEVAIEKILDLTDKMGGLSNAVIILTKLAFILATAMAAIFTLSLLANIQKITVAMFGLATATGLTVGLFLALVVAAVALGLAIAVVIDAVKNLNIEQRKSTKEFLDEAEKRILITQRASDKITNITKDRVAAQIREESKLTAAIQARLNKIEDEADLQKDVEKKVLDALIKTGNTAQALNSIMTKIRDGQEEFNDLVKENELEKASKELDKQASLIAKIGSLESGNRKRRKIDNSFEAAFDAKFNDKSRVNIPQTALDKALGRQRTRRKFLVAGSFNDRGDENEPPVNRFKKLEIELNKQILAQAKLLRAAAFKGGDVRKVETAELQKQIDLANEQVKIQKAINDRIQTQQERVRELISLSKQQNAAALGRNNQVRAALDAAISSGKIGKVTFDDASKASDRLQASLQKLFDGEALSPAEFNELSNAAKSFAINLRVAQAQAKGKLVDPSIIADVTNFTAGAKRAAQEAFRIQEALANIVTNQKSAANLSKAILFDIDLIDKGIGNFTDKGAARIDGIAVALERMSASLIIFTTSLSAAVNAIDGGAVPAANKVLQKTEKKSAGGIMMKRFAAGGNIAGDSILAKLNKHEFISDATTTRKNLAQLVAMNSNAARFSQGGQTNNTNIGDINVTVEGGDSSEQTIRGIASGLRREIRRGTIRLN